LGENRELPPVTVVISTYNRGSSIIATIESVLANDYPRFTVLVVDQSDDEATEAAVSRFRGDTRFRYLRSTIRGLGAGHNTGIRHATTELLAITDDDCLVPPHWLKAMVEAFTLHDRVALVFGNVYAGDYDARRGYIPVFERDTSYLMLSIRDNLFRGMGIGACMGIRHSAWAAVRGFDTLLGPGAPLGSLEDRDMAIRLLLAGYRVYCTPQFNVVHNGYRPNQALRGLAFRDWLGFGSAYAKYLKCGHWGLTDYLVGQMWFGQAVHRCFSHLRHVGTVRRVTPVATFWLGFLLGLTWPIDKQSLRFEIRPGGMYWLTVRRIATWHRAIRRSQPGARSARSGGRSRGVNSVTGT
jgi:GT2 family glycosyltransferase